MLSLEILLLHSVVRSLLGFAAKQKTYILEVLHKARKLMKRALEVMVFPSSMYLRVFQCLWMAFLGLVFAELCFAPVCLGAVLVWVHLFAGLADSTRAQLGCSFLILTFQSLNSLDRPLEIVFRLLDSLEQGG